MVFLEPVRPEQSKDGPQTARLGLEAAVRGSSTRAPKTYRGPRPALWHWFALNGSDARQLLAFPDIWRTYRGPLKRNGEPVELDVFAIMTTTPNELVVTINYERMPVLLTQEEHFETWLRGPPAEAFALARQHPVKAMWIAQARLEKEDRIAA
jgi:hypothetical protein